MINMIIIIILIIINIILILIIVISIRLDRHDECKSVVDELFMETEEEEKEEKKDDKVFFEKKEKEEEFMIAASSRFVGIILPIPPKRRINLYMRGETAPTIQYAFFR
jgi:sortase (surface protein transpeptidase)